ncbi:Bug family tripartite tricarboxylate transporter substrate binding protein [Falsiroseomonas sp. HW251]|uniref:Bug family tripartite tricarboxylate transporter substrate binding protein n=1 Tax=Falsiroseomonas sp. HW251 TaxID=3390998 RepID=UPI003D31B329
MLSRRTLGLAALALPAVAQAQNFERQIRWIVPYGAGGPTDTFARLIGRQMQARLGQAVLVDNRPGGGGVLATETLLQQPADGHTLLLVDNGMVVYSPALYARLPYDPDRQLTGVGLIARFPLILIVRNESPIRDWAQFLAAARAKAPTFGSGAVASPQHLGMEYLARRARFDAMHVPYRASPAAVQDLVAGQIDCMLTDSATSMGAIRQGQARALAVLTPARLPALPDVPTFRELGVDIDPAYAWMALCVAAATPAPMVARLNAVLNEAIATEEVMQVVRNLSAEPVPGDAAAFNAQISAESALWRPLIRELGIKLD